MLERHRQQVRPERIQAPLWRFTTRIQLFPQPRPGDAFRDSWLAVQRHDLFIILLQIALSGIKEIQRQSGRFDRRCLQAGCYEMTEGAVLSLAERRLQIHPNMVTKVIRRLLITTEKEMSDAQMLTPIAQSDVAFIGGYVAFATRCVEQWDACRQEHAKRDGRHIEMDRADISHRS
jgi:hypothetical protein